MVKTNSFKRPAQPATSTSTYHQREPIMSQNRGSVMQSINKESLSQVAGVGHLSDKRNSGLLQLNKNQNSLSLKKENKLTIDYYTVQNSKPQQQTPNTALQSSRQISHQPSNRQNNQGSAQKLSRPHNVVGIMSPGIKQPAQVTIRNSIKTEHRKQRAISNTKHVFNNFLNNASLSQNFSKKLPQKQIPGNYQNAYNEGSSTNKSQRKHQVSFGAKIANSPLPLQGALSKNSSSKVSNPYRSPQHNKNNLNAFSESCSPLPNKITSSQALTSIKQYPSQSKISKKQGTSLVHPMKKPAVALQSSRGQNLKQEKGINSISINTNRLQIDLSNVHVKTTQETIDSHRAEIKAVATSTINLAPKSSKTTLLKPNTTTKKGSAHHKKKTPQGAPGASSPIFGSKSNSVCPVTSDRKNNHKRSFKEDTKLIQVKQKKVPDTGIVKKQNKVNLSTRKDSSRLENISAHQINHTHENEENNNIPEIHSLNSLQKDDDLLVNEEEQKIEVPVETPKSSAETNTFPMPKRRFIQLHSQYLFNFEVEEVEKLKNDLIYFAGFTVKRSQDELKFVKGENEDEIQKELDDEEGYYNILLNDHLSYRYEILKVLGKGSFAQVVSCLDHKTGKKVAIKVTRNTELDHKFAQSESRLLNYLMKEDPKDRNNIVRMQDEFFFRNHHCFVFELLHSDLFEHLKENGFLGFPTNKIRNYAIQLLKALIFLENHNLIHCDLKPENILLRDEKCETLKLVDYGSGCFRDEQVYTYVQSRFYRAPEVILRLKYTEKVDIWSLGCILVELYTGEPLFPGNNEQEQLELIMEICGIPPAHVIDQSRKKDYYFDTDYSPFLIEEDDIGILRIPESKTLEQVVQCRDPYFVDFIKCCIELDPEQRLSAKQAIEHPWIKEGLESDSIFPHNQRDSILGRQREEEEEGAKAIALEESPHKVIDKNKVSLNKILNFNLTNDKLLPGEIDETESLGSTPGSEGNLDFTGKHKQIVEQSKNSNVQTNSIIRDEVGVKKPHSNIITSKQPIPGMSEPIPVSLKSQVEFIGKYEITKEDEPLTPLGDSPPNESAGHSFTTAAQIPGKDNTEQITSENTINKITVTVYQRRNTGNSKNQSISGNIPGVGSSQKQK